MKNIKELSNDFQKTAKKRQKIPEEIEDHYLTADYFEDYNELILLFEYWAHINNITESDLKASVGSLCVGTLQLVKENTKTKRLAGLFGRASRMFERGKLYHTVFERDLNPGVLSRIKKLLNESASISSLAAQAEENNDENESLRLWKFLFDAPLQINNKK